MVALVTGASSGIGRATAERLAADGMDLVVNFHSGARGADRAAVQSILVSAASRGRQAIALDADVSNRGAVARMVREAEARLGQIDVLVNNAGIELPATLESIADEDWDAMMAVNVKGQLLVIQAVAPGMRARGAGRIVNIASELALVGREGLAGYCASKAAVIGLTKALARELARDNILVNCVAPGPTDTDMLPPSQRTPELIERIPLGRIGAPEEIAAVVSFLVSSGNTWTTGQVLSPNGGLVT
jgi:3-oxoacyl-[acyl-carrier protein] reductase